MSEKSAKLLDSKSLTLSYRSSRFGPVYLTIALTEIETLRRQHMAATASYGQVTLIPITTSLKPYCGAGPRPAGAAEGEASSAGKGKLPSYGGQFGTGRSFGG